MTHLNKHGGSVGGAHDQVDFSAATSGGPIIANKESQIRLLQIEQRGVFRRIAHLFCGARFGDRFDLRNNH